MIKKSVWLPICMSHVSNYPNFNMVMRLWSNKPLNVLFIDAEVLILNCRFSTSSTLAGEAYTNLLRICDSTAFLFPLFVYLKRKSPILTSNKSIPRLFTFEQHPMILSYMPHRRRIHKSANDIHTQKDHIIGIHKAHNWRIKPTYHWFSILYSISVCTRPENPRKFLQFKLFFTYKWKISKCD